MQKETAFNGIAFCVSAGHLTQSEVHLVPSRDGEWNHEFKGKGSPDKYILEGL